MGGLSKGVLILLAVGVVGGQIFSALDTRPLTKIASNESASSEAAFLESMDNGVDPTDILEPTAAGKTLNSACEAGYIVGDLNDNRFSEISYASIDREGITYIQVSRYSPSYLIQEQDQIVTATEVDEIPDSIRRQLQRDIIEPDRCNNLDLYLSKIKTAE
jgi:hypothetical protein